LIERHGSGGPWEAAIGYSRAVRAGVLVFVSGCTAVGPDGEVVGGASAYEQAVQACRNLASALALAGAGPADLVQTRMFVTDISRWEEIGRAHAEAFGSEPPTSAMVEVKALIDPRMQVEIEGIAAVSDV
jgi:enamine deaminase RidA (YjgF/YER057c/UK114 family)